MDEERALAADDGELSVNQCFSLFRHEPERIAARHYGVEARGSRAFAFMRRRGGRRTAYPSCSIRNSSRERKRLSIFQGEIARLSGLSRQKTNKALHDLENSGLVRISYGVIEVLDLPGLQAYAHKN